MLVRCATAQKRITRFTKSASRATGIVLEPHFPMAIGPAEEVRAHVLTAHGQLRARSAELACEALRIARGATQHDLRVRGLVVELWTIVEATDEFEERELVPLLANADAWGAARVE